MKLLVAKEIKIGGLEQSYVDRFSIPAKTFAKNIAAYKNYTAITSLLPEAVAFGGIMLMILYVDVTKRAF